MDYFRDLDLEESQTINEPNYSLWQGLPSRSDRVFTINADSYSSTSIKVNLNTSYSYREVSLEVLNSDSPVSIQRVSETTWEVSSSKPTLVALVASTKGNSDGNLLSREQYNNGDYSYSNTLVLQLKDTTKVEYKDNPDALLLNQFERYKELMGIEDGNNRGSYSDIFSQISGTSPAIRDPRREVISSRSNFYEERKENTARINGLVQQSQIYHLLQEVQTLDVWSSFFVL